MTQEDAKTVIIDRIKILKQAVYYYQTDSGWQQWKGTL
jgi:hypothetical protein